MSQKSIPIEKLKSLSNEIKLRRTQDKDKMNKWEN